MIKRTTLFLFSWLTGCLAATAQSPCTPADMIQYKRVSNPVISDDGRLVAYVIATPRMEGEQSDFLSHVYVVSTDGKLNTQFTFGSTSCTNPRFSPDGQYLSFTSGRGKDGKNQLYLLRLTGGEAWPVTAQKGHMESYRWSPDGKRIAFTMSEPLITTQDKDRRERRDWDVVDSFRNAHLYTVGLVPDADGAHPVRRLTRGGFHVTAFNFSPNGRTLAFSHQPNSWENDYYLQDISTVAADSGAVRPLVSGKGLDHNPVFSPDGTSIAFVSDGDRPTRGDIDNWSVYVVPVAGGLARKLAPTPDENPMILGWTPDSRSVVVHEFLGTRMGLYLLPVGGSALTKLGIPDKGITQAHHLNSKGDVTYLYQSSDTPTDVYVTSLNEMTGRKLTEIHTDYTKAKPAPSRTELISWKAKDGKFTLEGLLTYPANYQPGRQYPLVLNPHGGPAAASAQLYTGSINGATYAIQAFAQQGYFVLRPNFRGSTGYGASFRAASFHDWGGGPYDDVMAGVDKVIATGLAHPDSLVVSGWSYGGYLTAMIITKTNRFKAAMAGAPVTNLMSFNGTADIPNFLPEYLGKEFWDDPKIYAGQSPMFNIKNAKTPTLILHGLADDRVPPEQGFQLHRALQRLGVPTQMVTYPRQPHGFTEPKFIQDASERTIEWFNRHLGRKQAGALVAEKKE